MEWFSSAADILGIASVFFSSIAGWQAYKGRQESKRERQRQQKKITIFLKSPTHNIKLPFELRRSEFTRQEILGRIGMFPMKVKGRRFEIQHLNTEEFLNKVYKIIDEDTEACLKIHCEPGELDQFDLTNFKHLLKPN